MDSISLQAFEIKVQNIIEKEFSKDISIKEKILLAVPQLIVKYERAEVLLKPKTESDISKANEKLRETIKKIKVDLIVLDAIANGKNYSQQFGKQIIKYISQLKSDPVTVPKIKDILETLNKV